MSSVEKVKNNLRKKKSKAPLQPKDLLSTGSTLLNLALTSRPNGGLVKGKYFFFVGDSSSGKTFLTLTCLAEASINPNFDDYRFIYDNVEDGALMDFTRYFGSAVAKRVEPPCEDGASESIEDFYYNIDDAIEDGRPFIYILDSMDALTSKEEGDKFEEQKTAHRKGKEAAGSYGDGKAKKNSANLRRVVHKLKKSGSILIIINQTRDNLGFGFDKKTRSGGRSLRFYACAELWSSVVKKLSKTVRGSKRQIGIISKIQIKKNRLTGKEWEVEIPLYHSFGIDDIGSCVDYLVAEKHWSETKGIVKAPEFEFKGSREKLIRHIEENDLYKDLQEMVREVWNDVEEACKVKRKSRYT